MTATAGTEAVRAVEAIRSKNRARQRQTTALQREWVLDGELTAEQLIAERDRRMAETRERNPDWGWVG